MSLAVLLAPRVNVLFILCFCKGALSKVEPFIVKGGEASIEKYPHSAFLDVTCGASWICGGSIVNQLFVLTAAHCVADCRSRGSISVVIGNAYKDSGVLRKASKYKAHDKFNDNAMSSDIALVMVSKAIPLGKMMKRVILQKNPPKSSVAFVAGWGLLNELYRTSAQRLMQAKQKLWTRFECSGVLGFLKPGLICGSAIQGKGYASSGDSGSALVVNSYYQVGLVSYKQPQIRADLVVYTDTAYFYDWIKTESLRLHCG